MEASSIECNILLISIMNKTGMEASSIECNILLISIMILKQNKTVMEAK